MFGSFFRYPFFESFFFPHQGDTFSRVQAWEIGQFLISNNVKRVGMVQISTGEFTVGGTETCPPTPPQLCKIREFLARDEKNRKRGKSSVSFSGNECIYLHANSLFGPPIIFYSIYRFDFDERVEGLWFSTAAAAFSATPFSLFIYCTYWTIECTCENNRKRCSRRFSRCGFIRVTFSTT